VKTPFYKLRRGVKQWWRPFICLSVCLSPVAHTWGLYENYENNRSENLLQCWDHESRWPNPRPQSRGLESLTAGLQSLRLASRLKPWLRTIDGLGWLMAASHGLQVQTTKLTGAY